MDTLVKTVTGSRLYGTNTPDSDWDYQSIHWASIEQLCSGKIVLDEDTSTNKKTRNTKDDVDNKSKELRAFIRDVLGGQTYALDLLYTPRSMILESSEVWEELLSLRDKMVTNNIRAFVGYCTTMASKFSNKSEKLVELRALEQYLKKFEGHTELGTALRDFDFSQYPRLEIITKHHKAGHDEDYLIIPYGSFPLNRKISQAMGPIQMRIGQFGKRSEAAAEAGGVDLKAYYHAMRVAWQLEDYLTNGELQFPCSRVSELINIRNGKYSRDYIDSWIDSELDRILKLPNDLPEPNYEFWDAWCNEKYLQYVKAAIKALEESGREIPSVGLKPIVLSS